LRICAAAGAFKKKHGDASEIGRARGMAKTFHIRETFQSLLK
jgi:hypothetical protein